LLPYVRASFRYSNDSDPALLGVSVTVRPGRMLGVTGPNGSGKSTLLNLILRAYIPQAGAIRLDDVDLRQIPVVDLRSRITYMPQKCDLFYGTIEQNLRLVHPMATAAEICWAVNMSGFSEDVATLTEGLQTRLSANSTMLLPRGFLQRLSLARTILKPAPVILMDEPESSMDFEGNLAVIRCLEYLKGRSTVILVSHRPSYLKLADGVLYLENGVIKKIGPFDQINDILTGKSNVNKTEL
jgi:ATP-binding cassette, subfamily C, bacterial LapB